MDGKGLETYPSAACLLFFWPFNTLLPRNDLSVTVGGFEPQRLRYLPKVAHLVSRLSTEARLHEAGLFRTGRAHDLASYAGGLGSCSSEEGR